MSADASPDVPDELTILAEVASFELGLICSESLFDAPVAAAPLLLPGCGDLQVAAIKRFGHRGQFPQPGEWENLLAMLEPGHELLWIITKRPGNGFSFHLAMKGEGQPQASANRTREMRASFRALMGQFAKRSFPESLAEECGEGSVVDLIEDILRHANREVAVTSGQPSPSKLEDDREFAESSENARAEGSLNDIIEPFADEPTFSVVFTVGRASQDDATEQMVRMTELRTALSPLLKVQEGRNVSQSEADTEGGQTSRAETIGQTEVRNFVAQALQQVFGSGATPRETGSNEDLLSFEDRRHGKWDHLKIGAKNILSRKVLRAAKMRQASVTETKTASTTKTVQQGASSTATKTDAALELVDQKLQDVIRSLKRASGTGAFYLGAEVFSPRRELSLRISRSISGCLAGARTHVRPFQTVIYQGEGFGDHLVKACKLEEIYPAITLQSRHIAAQFLPVPEADLPGLPTKRNVFYGKPNPSDARGGGGAEEANGGVWLGELAYLRNGFRTKRKGSATGGGESAEYRIPAEDVTSHVLIAGTTGSGKTQRAAAMLNRLSSGDFQVIVIESAKKTYRNLLRRHGVNTRILGLGANDGTALRINPFYFEPGTSLKRHISIFSDALADLLPVEALIGPKLREAIQRCYLKYEWDIESGTYQGTGKERYPTVVDLHMETLTLAEGLNYGPELKSNYKGALLGRTRLFFDELYQDIFGWGGSKPLTELFGEDDVIIEMDALPPSEAKMPSFVLSLLLERMRSWQHLERERGNTERRNLVIVIEEAHNLLEKTRENGASQREMGSGGFLLKQIVRLLQEGREAGMGLVVIDQSPASLADAVVQNTNTKVILRITDAEEADRIGTTLGLTKEECRDLHELEDGEAIVKAKGAGKALKLAPAAFVKGGREESTRPIAPASGPRPNYYRAMQTISSIVSIFENAESQREKRLLEQVAELASQGGSPEAERYLVQKLYATLAEADKLKKQVSATDFSAEAIALTLCQAADWASGMALSAQLQSLLRRISWQEAQSGFGTGGGQPLLPMVKARLATEPAWQEMGALEHFMDSYLAILHQDESVKTLDKHYADLLLLVHVGGDRRFEALKKIVLM